MRPPMVVEVEIAVDTTPLLFRGGVVVQADLFVLPREPGPFGQNVVQSPPFDQLLALLVNKRSLKDRKLSGC
jgi:hypothetical protein